MPGMSASTVQPFASSHTRRTVARSIQHQCVGLSGPGCLRGCLDRPTAWQPLLFSNGLVGSSDHLMCLAACTYECVMYWQAAARQRVAQARQRAQAAQDDFNAANAEVAAAREAWEVARNEFRDMACASPILATALPAAAAAPPLSVSAYLPPLPLPDFPPVAPDVVGVELRRTSDELPQTKVAHQPQYSTLTRSGHL